MSFVASHSECQASTKLGLRPHTQVRYTQVVSCLCFVSTERNETSKLLHFLPKKVILLTWIAFVFGSKTWLEKWELSQVSLWTEHISWV